MAKKKIVEETSQDDVVEEESKPEIVKELEESIEQEEKKQKERMNGTVKWFNPSKAYGFITGEDGKDYFVHSSQIPEGVRLHDADKVTFVLQKTDKGLQAAQIQKEA